MSNDSKAWDIPYRISDYPFASEPYPGRQYRSIADAIHDMDSLLTKAATPKIFVKHDSGKPRLSLIPREAIEGLGRVLTYGAQKYTVDNWRAGADWSRYIDAAMRHLVAFADGEDRDAETGELHTAHALACLAFLQAYAERGNGRDDRPKRADESLRTEGRE